MRKFVLTIAATAAVAVFTPAPAAYAHCDPEFEERTGYCNQCLLVADHSQRPEPIFCPL